MSDDDIRNLLYLEDARQKAEEKYDSNPKDADNLTRWGGVLLELCQFQSDSETMLLDAISKLEEALLVDPLKHEAMWCLGNAHMAHGLITPDYNVARNYIARAAKFYQQAVEEDPTNERYPRSLESIDQAPQLHNQIHKQRVAQQAAAGARCSTSHPKGTKKGWNFDLIFDIFGWVVLGIGIGAWIGFSRAQVHPSPRY